MWSCGGCDPGAVAPRRRHQSAASVAMGLAWALLVLVGPAGCFRSGANAPLAHAGAPQFRATAVEPLTICYDRARYCSHPREVLFQYFGGGELVLGHYHAACSYQDAAELDHYAVQDRCVVLMQRSHDGGRTWLPEEETVLFDQRLTPDRKRAYLFPAVAAPRPALNMFQPDALFFFGRTFFPPDHERIPVCFALRSVDRGRTWERAPTIIAHPDGGDVWIHRHAPPVVRCPDGRTLVAVFQAASRAKPGLADAEPAVFASTDNGVSWEYRGRPMMAPRGTGRFTYAALLPLPDGELQCYALHIDPQASAVEGLRNAICVASSTDAGMHWSAPVAITDGRALCWEAPRAGRYALASQDPLGGRVYRSPWPLRLRDGRILVLFARRQPPYGIGGVVSADAGRTWSEEFAIRSDSAGPDMGYPVGCELDDGQIFVAYYSQAADGNLLGGTRYIAGARFRLDVDR